MLRLATAALLVAGCSGGGDRAIEHEVAVMIGEPGLAADAAAEALVERGPDAILFLETGLWKADAHGRKRVIRALESIGDPEALPIVEYVAGHDEDGEVRARAAKAARALKNSP